MSLQSIFFSFKLFGQTSSDKVRQETGRGGFMMIELMISLAIMTMLTTVTLSANSKISSRINVSNLTQKIALDIREAQLKSVSSTATNYEESGVSQSIFPGYGVHFGSFVVLLDSGSPFMAGTLLSQYRLYMNFSKENPAFERVEGPTDDSDSSLRSLGGGYRIVDVKYKRKDDTEWNDVNHDSPNLLAREGLSISFQRPKPDALISYSRISTNGVYESELVDKAQITVSSRDGFAKTITVNSFGQIDVQ